VPRTALSVNLNKIALLRNTRSIGIPDLRQAARISLQAGAAGITVHPRPDQRHIRPDDVGTLTELLREEFPAAELNIEGNPFEGDFLDLLRKNRPRQATLVPDSPGQATSDHGWDPDADGTRLAPIVRELHDLGIRISCFMDADADAIRRLRDQLPRAHRIELYTEPYAAAHAGGNDLSERLQSFRAAALAAGECEFGVNAGHDLNQANLRAFLEAVPNVREVSIGHALISEAIFDGLAPTVGAYLTEIQAAQPR